MPIYEYECLSCKTRHEIIQKHSDRPITVCPKCGKKMKKLISNTSFVLKGTGWYKTDYAKKETTTEKKAVKKDDTKKETKTSAKDSTSASKGE